MAAAAGVTRLSHRLMRQFPAAKDGSSNLVFSPLCIYSALSQMAAGARGSTLSEFVDVLGCEEGLDDMMQLALAGGGPRPGDLQTAYACGLWHDATQTKLKPAYRDNCSIMDVVGAVDFFNRPEEARTHINRWVEGATGGGLVDSILHPGSVDKDTRLVHTSAFSLEAFWETPFHRWRNKHYKFHRLDGTDGDDDTLFMHSYEDQFVATHQGFKVLRMPYTLQLHEHGDDDHSMCVAGTLPRYSMCVFLPDARDGLWNLEEQMASSPSGFLREHLPGRRVSVGEFRLPKFKVSLSSRSCSLKQVLQGLGIKAVFGTGADVLAMLDVDDPDSSEPIYVSDMLHEAAIAVDEEGTEPADPSSCTLCTSCLWPDQRSRPPGCVDFVADHPFVFFVLEELTGAILLAGHVLHPTQG